MDNLKLAIIGLGYVGLPLAVEFGKVREVIAFDINKLRVNELLNHHDATRECTPAEMAAATLVEFTSNPDDLRAANCFIVTVPTPIDDSKKPDLTSLINASNMIGKLMKPGALVIYESTVYPGATEEICVPVLEAASGLTYNLDFFCGYSPERINPGDKLHRLNSITKITSGSTASVARRVDDLYSQIISAGTVNVGSIAIAEAAKVIENTQRDLNIALINELAMLFDRLDLDTDSILKAASTKWNFLPFKPGLVGGHCIGVDPYYLTHKAQSVGFNPQIILAGRLVNDQMGCYVASKLIKHMIRNGISIQGSKVLIMGLAFKENCPDIRNTKVVDVISELKDFGINVDVYDPCVDQNEVMSEYGVVLVQEPPEGHYDANLLLVPHDIFAQKGSAYARNFLKSSGVFFDVKSVFGKDESDCRL